MPACALCGAASAVLRCGRCKSVVYCSAEHQRSHWAVHKVECAAIAAPPSAATQPPAKVIATSSVPTAPLPIASTGTQDTSAVSRAVSLVHGLRKALLADAARRPAYLKSGAIAAMLAPGAFTRTLYPGSAPEGASSRPQTLEALLLSRDPSDVELVEEAAVRAVDRGAAILAAVRRRGAAEGDELTAATEVTLWPQARARGAGAGCPILPPF